MIRSNGSLCARAIARRQDGRPRHSSIALEPLEQRRMLDAAYINEIYIDPPSGSDSINEYIELRGTPGMSLDNTYLLIIENENDIFNNGHTGEIEKIFDLSGLQMGSNGFLVMREAGNPYTVAPGTTELTYSGTLENSGFTAMLIQTDGLPANVPVLNYDLDAGNDGLDVPNGHAGWTILDSIGIHSEAGEASYGRLYGTINFGPESTTNIEPGATYVGVGYEIEYIGRWGNSTGQTEDDWHVSNLTDNALAGYTGNGDFRQSGDPQGMGAPGQIVETNKDVPYGTNLTNTLGGPNLGPATEVYINEIYFDPPSGSDIVNEYIELRGTPNMALDDYYLIIIENENDVFNEGFAGDIERVYDFTGQTLGSNGYMVLHQSGHPYTIAPGTTEMIYTGVLENSGFTAMLIKNNGGAGSVPVASDITPMDLDTNNDGLDVASGNINWDVKDSIGIHSEADELAYGILYGAVNYGPGPNGVPIANYTDVGFEIEYVGRWGNSTGSAPLDWHVSNLTDNPLSGFTGTGDFRQSADPHGSANVESNQGVAYGTNLTNTLGADNYPLNVVPSTTIASHHIYYNQSAWDGNNAAIDPVNDNAAIAPDKTAYLPGAGVAVYDNITSFSRGITGITVDLSVGVDHSGITASDFVFKVGNDNTPSGWAAAPSPTAISVVPGGGDGGSDRVYITFASGAVRNTWLEVQVKATANTGLAADDVHFWGNKIGDSGSATPATTFSTTTTDSIQVFAFLGGSKPIDDLRDYNRDGQVTTTDSLIVFSNLGTITRIDIPGAGPFAPEAEPAVADNTSSSAVATALTLPKLSGLPKLPSWISDRLASVDLDSGPIANLFTALADSGSPKAKSLLLAADEIADTLGLDDSLLDSLIAGLA